jgi:hypothetical protein
VAARPAAAKAPAAAPATAHAAGQVTRHKVAKGEDLTRILRKLHPGSSAGDIQRLALQVAKANHLKSPDAVHAGMELTIPAM